MPSLINKLNVLVKSNLHGVIGDDSPDTARRKKSASLPLGKDIDREIAALRQQIEQAFDEEDRMTAASEALQRQIEDWDQQADQALGRGDEATARHAVRQMQLQQQHLAMTVADLAQHRLATSELIQRVNQLEALVAEARRQPAETLTPEEDDESLSVRLRKARQQAGEQVEVPAPHPADVDEKGVEDDLARRRARLSQ
jgi:hypothetical protein